MALPPRWGSEMVTEQEMFVERQNVEVHSLNCKRSLSISSSMATFR